MTTATLERPVETRALATIETITSVRPNPNADSLDTVRVRGWNVVTVKGDYKVGDACLYIEIDTHLDTSDPRFAFLAPRGERTNEDGFTGHVLKTARLRGQYSQGIVFDLEDFPELAGFSSGDDVTAALGLFKWDPPIPASMAGRVRGVFPSDLPATGELRVENFAELIAAGQGVNWVATEKVDGMSMSVWASADDAGVAQRGYDMEYEAGNPLWATALSMNLHEQLRASFPGRSAIQGELFGPAIAQNRLQLKEKRFLAFNIVADGEHVPRSEWPQWALDISVPIHDLPFPTSVEEALDQVEGLRSLVNPARPAEGVVWRPVDITHVEVNGYMERASMKVISRKYLTKADR